MSHDDRHEKRYAKGEFVFKEGSWGDRIFEVESGEILLFKKGQYDNLVPLGKIGPGEIFGEMFLLNKEHTRNASAVAFSEVVVKVYFEDTIIQDLVDMQPRQRKLVESLTSKLTKITEAYVREMSEVLNKNKDLVEQSQQSEGANAVRQLYKTHEGVRNQKVYSQQDEI